MSEDDEILLHKLLVEEAEYQKYNKLSLYDPYPFQVEFHNDLDEREALQAGNQIGKTVAGCVQDSFDLTGLYPEWYEGYMFDRPVEIVCGGINNDKTTDLLQKALFGKPVEKEISFGTGWIPKDCLDIKKTSLKRGVSDAFLRVMVKHHRQAKAIKGIKRVLDKKYMPVDGWSTTTLQSYAAGKEAWMGDTIDVFHLDEEPPLDILEQAGRGCIASGGRIRCTFTPENGQTKVVNIIKKDWSLHTAGWPDVSGINLDYEINIEGKFEKIKLREVRTLNGNLGHVNAKTIKNAERDFPPYKIKMRMLGIPVLGSGQVYTYSEETIKIAPLDEIPASWPRGAAIDFGGTSDESHPSAVVFGAWDEVNDIVYVIGGFKSYGREVADVAAKIISKPDMDWMPMFWPHDGNRGKNRNDPGGGTTAQQYAKFGIKMHDWHFTNPDEDKGDRGGGIKIEPGIVEISGRISDRRLRVFNTFIEWFEEYRNYHQKDGKIIDLDDDVMAATRYLVQMRRHFIKESDAKDYDDYDEFDDSNEPQGSTGYG